jgi:MFS family permease
VESKSTSVEVRAMATGALGLVVAALPVFLIGGLAVQVRAELRFDEAALGGAITAFFVAAGAGSIPGGRTADRIGPRRALLAGTFGTALGLCGLALAQDWTQVTAALAVAGLSLGLTEPAIALTLARFVPGRRQGFAFGVKEAAIPASTLLAGAAVPAIALTVGWRWAFAAALLLVPPLVALAPAFVEARPPRPSAAPGGGGRSDEPDPGRRGGGARRRASAPLAGPLAIVAAGCGVGVAAVTAMSAFLVESTVAAGWSQGRAGLLLSAGSVGGVVVRVMVGVLADRSARPQFSVIAAMQVTGAVALLLLAVASAPGASGAGPLLVTGALAAFGLGWGWTGLLFLSAVRTAPDAAGSAAGIALAGLSIGGATGPLLFGVLVTVASYAVAWAAGAGAMVVGALLVLLGGRRLTRQAQRSSV